MAALGVDPRGQEIMAPKGRFFLVRAEGLDPRAALILKQEMLAKGGEAAVPRKVYDGMGEKAEIILMGTEAQLKAVCRILAEEPFGLRGLGEELALILARTENPPPPIRMRGRAFVGGARTCIMGIINATPDSFSGDGLAGEPDPVAAAVARAKAMVEAGAEIIDIGAESTRPGAAPVEAEEELARLLPVLRAVAAAVDVPISVDTYKAAGAAAALENGASLVNDVWGFQRDPEMVRVVAAAGIPAIIMHNQVGTEYAGDIMAAILRFLRRSIELAETAGLPAERVIVDPGIGFGKSREQNLEVLRRLGELRSLGRPILLGTSRKSVIGLTLNLPVGERLWGTAATVALGIAGGADIVRVHDVAEMAQVVRMSDAILRGGPR
ncbi:MAG: dihydropteroate synthase [Firmicutes bacterium]|nr:dihydropteroate synthase [Bacillota bacterium]